MIENGSRLGLMARLALCAIISFSLAACGGEQTKPNAASSAPADTPADTPAAPPPAPPANNAPVIDGQPALTAQVGVAYSYVPTSSDADNDTLTFTITGLPAWATFDATNGSLSGTPNDGHVGQSDDIEITVSDGKAQDFIGRSASRWPRATSSRPSRSE
jgi:hypothetical protein